MRKLLVVLLAGLLVLSGCGSASSKNTIGISMPTKDLERWEKDGNGMVEAAKKAGYDTDIQYANNDVPTQVSQIENLITKGVKLIIIAPIDGGALTEVTKKAKAAGITVFSYDRLITGTDAIDYYATFSLEKVGNLQGQYIVDALKLETETGPFNLELFGGAPDDNNATYFFKGAMDVLQPYITSGKLVIKSGQTAFNQVATKSWDRATAQARMENLLSGNYTTDRVDAILAQNDAIAQGVVSALKSVGYGTDARKMPIITGQDAETASVKSIIAGEQTMTVFKDTTALANESIRIADAVIKGSAPATTITMNNGSKDVATYYLEPVSVDLSNYKTVLIDSGYIAEADLK